MLGQILSAGSFKDRKNANSYCKVTSKKPVRPMESSIERDNNKSIKQISKCSAQNSTIEDITKEVDISVKKLEQLRSHSLALRSVSIGSKNSGTIDRGSQNLSNLSINLNPTRKQAANGYFNKKNS